MTDIPVPGRPGETIESLSDEEIDDVISNASDSDDYFPTSWIFALAVEVKQRRASVACKYCDMGHREHRAGCPMLVLCDAARTALSTAAFELKERRNNYAAMLARCTPATDPFVIESYRDGVKACDAAIEVVERLAKGGG